MDIRNPQYTADGRIDCEIEHPTFGWIPFTADQNDLEKHGRDIYAAALEMGPAAYVAPPTPPATTADIDRERDHRLNNTFTFNGKEFQFGPESKTRIAGAGTLAGFAIANGAVEGDVYWNDPTGTEPFTWIAADNSFVQMDALTCFAFAQTAAKYESKLIFAARALKDMAEIPQDYKDDKYWT